MKAVVYNQYGPPDVLQYKEVEKPIANDNEVLVKIYATGVNNWDWDLLRGEPRFFRILSGFRKPRYPILGSDIAGIVESVGKKVNTFKAGDAVFADSCEYGWGGFAEYVCLHEQMVTKKPAHLTFEEAASIPQAGVMALLGMINKRKVHPGEKVIINGAGGGVGTFAIQFAKHFGAEITGVDKESKFDLMQSLGAKHVIDYTKEDFTKNGEKYDRIIDVVANRSLYEYRRALHKNGLFFMIGGTVPAIFQAILLGPAISLFGSRKLGILAHKPNAHLDIILDWFEKGVVRSIIDRQFSLTETADALKYIGEGHVKGKVVIKINNA